MKPDGDAGENLSQGITPSPQGPPAGHGSPAGRASAKSATPLVAVERPAPQRPFLPGRRFGEKNGTQNIVPVMLCKPAISLAS
jgi:hypothetical protein